MDESLHESKRRCFTRVNHNMPRPVVVLNVVGLTPSMLGNRTPQINAVAQRGFVAELGTVLPAVTCSAQATLLTGKLPREHGIVSNGWYCRDLAEVLFWKQSNHLIQSERIYETALARDPSHTTAKLFWWYNMYAPVAWSMTPRPSYPADGRKVFDSYSQPPELRDEYQQRYGLFPLLKFWGPGADITSSRWIAQMSADLIREKTPSLTLVYLPHLDYSLQRLGPKAPAIHREIELIDAEVGRVVQAADAIGAETVILSEYGISEVSQPVHLNRILRESGDLVVRREPLGWETLDCGASKAFAVADHQVAHIYVRRDEDLSRVKKLLQSVPGIERVLDRSEQAEFGIDHPRSGELVAVAQPGCWFTYYFWQDDSLAPDYARTVDIHRKPGYDPVELFVDPNLKWPQFRIARRLLQKKLGFRYYMDVIGLDASIVRGSHGRLPTPGREAEEGPVLISSSKHFARDRFAMTEVRDYLLNLQFST